MIAMSRTPKTRTAEIGFTRVSAVLRDPMFSGIKPRLENA
jgi:hypothetical protein